MEQFSSKSWYPVGLVKETTKNENIGLFQHFSIHTEFGTLDMLNFEGLDDVKKFNELINQINKIDGFEVWGDFNNLETLNVGTNLS